MSTMTIAGLVSAVKTRGCDSLGSLHIIEGKYGELYVPIPDSMPDTEPSESWR
jgi:hypothetical protein